jgi:aspartyl protease family protein
MLGWIAAILIILVAAFVYFSSGGNLDDGGRLVYAAVLGALGLLYLVFVAGDYRGKASQGLKHALTWALILFALLAGYSYRGELKSVLYRVAGEVLPPGHVMTVDTGNSGEKAVRIRGDGGGHFSAQGSVNGADVRLMVDTGASTVVLKAADAELAGIALDGLSFTVPVQTANGTAYAAPVRLREIAIGPIAFDDVEALVAKPGSLNESLLGMSFLKRLRSYEVVGDFMTLRG